MTRKTIGCLVAHVEGTYNRNLWRIIRLAAERADCNLFVFEGRRLRDRGNERRHNAIYKLAERFHPDGWLVAGTQIVNYVPLEEYDAFCSRYKENTPLVSLGVELPNAANVLLDNGLGLRRLMEHLIRAHGYRHIAFVKGPNGNLEANERYQVYLKAMNSHRLPVDPGLVFDGNFSSVEGYEACKAIHESGTACDCIVCANDDMAMGAYSYVRELRRKGIQPRVEHITGFDNSLLFLHIRPSLTTVAQPLDRMVERSFDILMAAVPGQHLLERTVFPSALVIRESCGCHFTGEADGSEELLAQPERNIRIHQSMQSYSLEDLFDELTRLLPYVGIRSCFIVRYDQPQSGEMPWDPPAESEMLFAYAGGQRIAQDGPNRFTTAELLPPALRSSGERATYLIKPLFFRDEQYGYVVLEAVGDDTRNVEGLRGQIADSLKFVLMMDRQKAIETDLAKSIGELQETNRQLNDAANRDPMTGLYNRSGFLHHAGRHLADPSLIGASDLVLFVDIHHLKTINHTYGYTEGDKAILATADILARVLSPDDILARFCGDEFVLLLKNTSEGHFSEIQSRISELLTGFKEKSGSPLELFIGHKTVRHGQDDDVEKIIQNADYDLYQHKTQRPETI